MKTPDRSRFVVPDAPFSRVCVCVCDFPVIIPDQRAYTGVRLEDAFMSALSLRGTTKGTEPYILSLFYNVDLGAKIFYSPGYVLCFK